MLWTGYCKIILAIVWETDQKATWQESLLEATAVVVITVITVWTRMWDFPDGASGKEPACQCRRCKTHGFDPWVRKIPCRKKLQPTPVILPGESPWTKEPGGLQSIGFQRVKHNWGYLAHMHKLGCDNGDRKVDRLRVCPEMKQVWTMDLKKVTRKEGHADFQVSQHGARKRETFEDIHYKYKLFHFQNI